MEDMTLGSPWKLIVRFTIPLLMGNIFQQLYSLMDTIIIGRSLGMNALGAIGAVGSLTFFVQGFVLGIASGLSLILAQRFGAKNEERIRSSYIASLWISMGMVLLLTIISILFSDLLLRMMNIPDELFHDSKAYFITAMFGLSALLFFNLMCNVLRSKGDTKHLLVFTVFSQLLNIVFDFIFIIVLDFGVSGVAFATILSQLIVGVFCQNYVIKKVPIFKLGRKDLRADKREVRLHLDISLPMGFQSSIIAVGSIILQYKLNGLGSAAVEGHAIGGRVENMLTMPMVTFGVATATFAAQNYGAGDLSRIWRGVKASLIISLSYGLVVGLLLFFYGSDLAQWLFGAESGETIAFVDRYFKWTTLFYMVLSVVFVVRYCLQGMGKAVAPTIGGFMEMGMRSLVPLFFTGIFGFRAIVISHPLSWMGTAIVLVVALYLVKKGDRTTKWKRFLTS
ncbi:MATE family efflux transporter [Jeotgalibaca caeni]|uniref:MATE family efflux transporter n=1 Tax=Jeotgalibaca caeni TaxID=3028623 RepID=UPI00237DB842|nr:MATE family efflux transporter [Jeotgalibaca caeni]MDE1549079.1 MATE family efflux transporter [Jeotgalibaca caeni]